eukprot:2403048-Rhodomonas_salina.1
MGNRSAQVLELRSEGEDGRFGGGGGGGAEVFLKLQRRCAALAAQVTLLSLSDLDIPSEPLASSPTPLLPCSL